jgi:hypothetical protein
LFTLDQGLETPLRVLEVAIRDGERALASEVL